MSLRSVVFSSLADIDAQEWDSIVTPRHFFQRYAFQRTLAESIINDCEYRYFTTRDEQGDLLAHCSYYSISTPLDLFVPRRSRTARLLKRVRSVYKRFLDFRIVECGSPTALGHPISFREGVSREERLEVLRALVAAMEEFARQKKADLLVLRDFRTGELEDVDGLKEAGFRCVPNLEDARLQVRWTSFDQYLGSLRSHYRRQIRLNRQKAARAELRSERVTAFDPFCEDMARLWSETYARSKEYQREKLGADYFRNLAKNLGNDAFVTLFWMGDRIVAFTLYVMNDDVLVPSYIGVDYAHHEAAGLVFNAYYDWISTAIELNCPVVEMGITTYEPKLRLGAEVESLHVLIRFRRPRLTPAVAAIYRWMTPQQKVRRRHVFSDVSAHETEIDREIELGREMVERSATSNDRRTLSTLPRLEVGVVEEHSAIESGRSAR